MKPFTIAIPDVEIADLKERLGRTRFPATLEGVGWDYGIDDAFLRSFVPYWANHFDWRAAESRLNGFAQFTDDIDGELVHFVHVRGEGANRVPLLLTNGWPANFVELLPLVPRLTREIEGTSFDVVIPSLPGYGFSGQPRRPGMNLTKIGHLWAELMTRLGYERFLISGSDLGAGAELTMVRIAPERVIGAHYVNCYPGYPPPEDPTPEESAYLKDLHIRQMTEGAYAMEQGTKPATLAVGLNDSPAGLAAWILEKYHGWTDAGDDMLKVYNVDDLCTILSVYWFTQTIGSSMRLYKEAFADPEFAQAPAPHAVPHAILMPPADNPTPRARAERHLQNIVRWTELTRGGHFPALEIPDEMAEDIRGFYSQIA